MFINMFINSISHNINSIYKPNKRLLDKPPEIHPLTRPNGPIYSAIHKAEIFSDTFEAQFSVNPGQDLPEIHSTLH